MSEHAALERKAVPTDDGPIIRALDWITGGHLRAVGALILISLACFLPGQTSIPAVDRDEARYVQATTEMLETGDYIDIRLHRQPRYIQPAGIYWLQAAAVRLFGGEVPAPIWVHRLPSLIGAGLIVLLSYWCGLAFGSRKVALLAGMMMAAMLLLNVEARLAKTDAVLNAAILACQGVLLRLYLRDREHPFNLALMLTFWLAAGVGIVVKGPILPLVVGLTIVAASIAARDIGWLRSLRPLVGLPIALAVAAPWYVAIWILTDGAFFKEAISFNVVGKITTGHQSHGFPPGFYATVFWITAWPVAAVAATALPAIWRARKSKWIWFLASWVLPTWIAYEFFATKLPHYMLPLYPAIAFAAAWALAEDRIDAGRIWVRIFFVLAAVGPIVLVAVSFAAAIMLGDAIPTAAVALAIAVVVLSIVALRFILVRSLLAGWLILAVGVAPVTYACLFGAVAPNLNSLWLSPRLAAAAVDVAGCDDPDVISVGDDEASLIFAVGTDIRFGDAEAAARFLQEKPCRAAIVRRGSVSAFVAQAASQATELGAMTEIVGVNIGNTRRVEFEVYGSAGDVSK